jgi:hypothetical protein
MAAQAAGLGGWVTPHTLRHNSEDWIIPGPPRSNFLSLSLSIGCDRPSIDGSE